MKVTMIKKRLADGRACAKCVEAEALLKRRDAWTFVDAVVWADEGDPTSEGMRLAEEHGVELAPFFLVRDDEGETTVYTSALKLHRALLKAHPTPAPDMVSQSISVEAHAHRLEHAEPQQVVRWALETHGSTLAIAFSGAEDVALIDMASKTGLPFEVFILDTGRLHPETLRFVEKVRAHYGIEISVMYPNAEALQAFVRERGLFSFFEEGHQPCCALRKVEPLRRALSGRSAWMTGQRRDQNPATRGELRVVEQDAVFASPDQPLVKVNPLASWSSEHVWRYLRTEAVPTNPLHDHGYKSIGCEPCTRPVRAEQAEREGRWWWESTDARECGLHLDLSAKG